MSKFRESIALGEEVNMKRRGFLRLAGGAAGLAVLPVGCSMIGIGKGLEDRKEQRVRKGQSMKIERLAMPPFNTTLMGVVKGALDYHNADHNIGHDVEMSAAFVFGASGHAFLINIHKELCPSGPYCWNRDAASPLIRNLGLEMSDLGFYCLESSRQDRASVEAKLRAALDEGIPCSLLNMENQLIAGYDDEGFFVVQPWPGMCPENVTPARLTFGSWKEFGEECHVNFYILRRVTPLDRRSPINHRKAVLDSLDYAVDLHANPAKHTSKDYGVGPHAYTNWIAAAAEYGASHGNWWNGTVWSECRQMASRYFAEIQQTYEDAAPAASELTRAYADIAGALGRLSDKAMPAVEKVKLLGETQRKEAEAIRKVAAVAAAIRSGH